MKPVDVSKIPVVCISNNLVFRNAMSKIFMCNNTYYALKDNKLFEITKEEFSNIIRKEAAYKIEPMQINKKMLKG